METITVETKYSYSLIKRVWVEKTLKVTEVHSFNEDYGNGLNTAIRHSIFQINGTGVIYERIAPRGRENTAAKITVVDDVIIKTEYGVFFDDHQKCYDELIIPENLIEIS